MSKKTTVIESWQESKPDADVGYLLPAIPDEIICAHNQTLVRYGKMLVELEAVTDNVTYAEFVSRHPLNGGK